MTIVLEIPLDEEVMAFLATYVPFHSLPMRVGSDGERGVYRIEVGAEMLEAYNVQRARGATATLSEFIATLFQNGARGVYDDDLAAFMARRSQVEDPLLLTVPRAEAELARTLDDIEERAAADRAAGGSDFTRAMLAAAYDRAETWRILLRSARDSEARANGEPTEDPETIKTALADALAQHDAFQVRWERYKATGIWE